MAVRRIDSARTRLSSSLGETNKRGAHNESAVCVQQLQLIEYNKKVASLAAIRFWLSPWLSLSDVVGTKQKCCSCYCPCCVCVSTVCPSHWPNYNSIPLFLCIFILRAADIGTRPADGAVNAATKLALAHVDRLFFCNERLSVLLPCGEGRVQSNGGERPPQEATAATDQRLCSPLAENGKCFDVIHTNLDINTLAIHCETKDNRLCRALSFRARFIALSHPAAGCKRENFAISSGSVHF